MFDASSALLIILHRIADFRVSSEELAEPFVLFFAEREIHGSQLKPLNLLALVVDFF
jgi:hypothetical protein